MEGPRSVAVVIDGVGIRGDSANPASRKRLAQPDSGFLHNGRRYGAWHDGRVQIDPRYALFHDSPGRFRWPRFSVSRACFKKPTDKRRGDT